VTINAETHLGERLCKAWGLDPMRVERIAIDVTAHRLPVVTVTMFTDDAAARILTEYHLAPTGNVYPAGPQS
jgi:hypothetical protein